MHGFMSAPVYRQPPGVFPQHPVTESLRVLLPGLTCSMMTVSCTKPALKLGSEEPVEEGPRAAADEPRASPACACRSGSRISARSCTASGCAVGGGVAGANGAGQQQQHSSADGLN